jgi:hypothetical protein
MTAIQCGLAAFAPRTQLASWVNAALPDVPPARRKGYHDLRSVKVRE